MLTEAELETYMEGLQLTKEAKEFVRLTRLAPSRLVGTSAKNNICTWWVSEKTSQTIQTESKTCERAYVLELEYAKRVMEYWDQVQPVMLTRASSSSPYRADFLVLEIDEIFVAQTKTERELRELLAGSHPDWQQQGTKAIYLPAQAAFADLGLQHRVVTSAAFNTIRTSNLGTLMRSRKATSDVTEDMRARLAAVMAREAWVRLSALQVELCLPDLTWLIQLVDCGVLHANLCDSLLSDPESTWVSSSADMLALKKEQTMKMLDSETINADTLLIPSYGRATHCLENLRRLRSGEKSRSIRRWKKSIREGKSEYEAALPNTHLRGNRESRLNKVVVKFLRNFILEKYATSNRPSKRLSHADYKNEAKKKHPRFPPVSPATFNRYIDLEDNEKIGAGRGGRRAANAAASPSPVEERALHATRAFEWGAMDHFKADVMCRVTSAHGKVYSMRPWLSVMMDIRTRFILAFWLSFLSPSVRTCALLMRLCVRTHGRLPESILVDRGAEFTSVYMHALEAHCKSELALRPSENPRYGGEMERVYGIFKSKWLSRRPGNLAQYKEARSVSKTHAPSAKAALTIEHLLADKLEFVDWYNDTALGHQENSPQDLLTNDLKLLPFSGARVQYDNNFIIASAVDVRKYSVDPARGIHTDDDLHYWHEKLASLGNRPTEVRKEPEDPYRIYAKVKNEWITCLASGSRRFHTLDPVHRLAHAVRFLDGREMRRQAKDDAEQLLIERIQNLDRKRADESANVVQLSSAIEKRKGMKSIFEQARKTDIPPLEPSSWDE